MYIFAHEGHEHNDQALAQVSSNDAGSTIVIVAVVVAVIALAVVIRHRSKK